MSVVAGCTLFDGVLLLADSRVTFPGNPDRYVDNAQKLFPISPDTAIGFAGDLRVASILLQGMAEPVKRRRCRDAISLHLWLPRYFRYAYSQLDASLGGRSVAFMIASALRDRSTVVEKQIVRDLMFYAVSGEGVSRGNWVPGLAVDILNAPTPAVAIGGTHRGVLFSLQSPRFTPVYCPPLNFMAIGSGQAAIQEVSRIRNSIILDHHGETNLEAMWLEDAVSSFVREKRIAGVGGLYPLIKVSSRGVEMLGRGVTYFRRGGDCEVEARIELAVENGQWVQRNATTGREIPLVPPWRIKRADLAIGTFEDLDQMYNS